MALAVHYLPGLLIVIKTVVGDQVVIIWITMITVTVDTAPIIKVIDGNTIIQYQYGLHHITNANGKTITVSTCNLLLHVAAIIDFVHRESTTHRIIYNYCTIIYVVYIIPYTVIITGTLISKLRYMNYYKSRYILMNCLQTTFTRRHIRDPILDLDVFNARHRLCVLTLFIRRFISNRDCYGSKDYRHFLLGIK